MEKPAPTPLPPGYRRALESEVTPELRASAARIRDSSGFTAMPYGTTIDLGGDFAAFIEQHYHEPGGPARPWGYHHGVTIIRRAGGSEAA